MSSHSLGEQTTITAEPTNKIPVLPDESFWQRYSPHRELPLSLSSSGIVHVVIIALMLLGGIVAAQWDSQRTIPIDVVEVGTGGGRPDAGAGRGADSDPREAVPQNLAPEPKAEPAQVAPLKPVAVVPRPIVGQEPQERPFENKIIDERFKKLLQLIESKQEDGHPNGSPPTGPRSDGGPGPGKLNVRVQRQLRWVMIFNIHQPEDYARQLHDLKAILAIPIAGKEKEFLVIEDLTKRPVKPSTKDVSEMNRIFWVDDRPESVSSLARVLGVAPVPPYFVAFFPQELENKLLEKELAHAKGKPEDLIEETRFQIRSTAKGYEPLVIDQRYRNSQTK